MSSLEGAFICRACFSRRRLRDRESTRHTICDGAGNGVGWKAARCGAMRCGGCKVLCCRSLDVPSTRLEAFLCEALPHPRWLVREEPDRCRLSQNDGLGMARYFVDYKGLRLDDYALEDAYY